MVEWGSEDASNSTIEVSRAGIVIGFRMQEHLLPSGSNMKIFQYPWLSITETSACISYLN